jgi:hypothetical protein
VADAASDGLDPSQDSRPHAAHDRPPAVGTSRREPQPRAAGWGAYFRYGNSARKFATIDAYVNQRMAILASTKHGLRGWNWTTRFTHGWVTSLGVYRLNGTIRPTTAYASR